jgi:hypothetical protein
LNLSEPSGRRLTIAKELYLHGYSHSLRRSISDSILSILNFDFCAETIIKTVLLDRGVRIERQRGGFKTHDELISDLRHNFPNLSYIDEVISLHRLRNDVQHQSNIPSEQEVSRHKTTVRLFFEEVCQKVYDGTISYDDISLALFIKSENEKTILGMMEKTFQERSYSDSVYYGKQVAIYHTMLLRLNLGVPHPRSFRSPFSFRESGDLREIGEVLEETTERLNWAIDRLCLREHYDEINQLLGKNITSPFFLSSYRAEIQRVQASQNEAEQTRNLVYEFITSTQDLIKEQDLKSPFVFDLVVKKAESGECVQVGFVSVSSIASAELSIGEPFSEDVHGEYRSLNIPKESGLHIVPMPIQGLEKGRQYQILCIVKDEKGERDTAYFEFET